MTAIGGAVEVATAIQALRPGHITRGQLKAVLLDHLTVESLAQLAALSEVLVRVAAVRVDVLLADPALLAGAMSRAAVGQPMTARELGVEYGPLLRSVGQASAIVGGRDAGQQR